ncbi:Uncharacterised protein [Mycobacteroides abscessus subsp. abscessus]|nr:Uncharacterised protein [Mycobacteroides abscessus subsp. abscessus]
MPLGLEGVGQYRGDDVGDLRLRVENGLGLAFGADGHTSGYPEEVRDALDDLTNGLTSVHSPVLRRGSDITPDTAKTMFRKSTGQTTRAVDGVSATEGGKRRLSLMFLEEIFPSYRSLPAASHLIQAALLVGAVICVILTGRAIATTNKREKLLSFLFAPRL